MTLSFTQTINGKPNYFIEKIWACSALTNFYTQHTKGLYYLDSLVITGKYWDDVKFGNKINPKLHTIREDKKNRWGADCDIHMVINNRTPNRFQFAPVIKCVSVQDIEMRNVSHLVGVEADYHIVLGFPVKDVVFNLAFTVMIDGILQSRNQLKKLAINDGFDSVEDFFAYFNKDFTGKIIHWTILKY